MSARRDKSHGFLPAAKLLTVWEANLYKEQQPVVGKQVGL